MLMQIPPLGQIKEKVTTAFRDVSPLHKYARKPGENYFQYPANGTRLVFHTIGLGDIMMIRQFGRAFQAYLAEQGDPELGDIVITSGGYAPKLDQERGDFNAYWWYSHGPMDDSPGRFVEDHLRPNLDPEPDVILCGSKRIEREAQKHGFETLYFPIAQYGFEPLELKRCGLGYAGSRWHKSTKKLQQLLGPFRGRSDFEWVSDFTLPEQLNLWYNTREATFGVTKEGQRQWGVVNSRVFETLASGTPLILRDHPTVNDVLGFEYPYQVSSTEEAKELVDQFSANPRHTAQEFRSYSRNIRSEHSYANRVETLVNHVK